MHHPTRPGLSRPEVMVLVAMVLVIVGLAVPAILRVREQQNEAQCRVNLRLVGLASHMFHGDYNKLPSGYYSAVFVNGQNTNYSPERGPHIGCLAFMLPYLEKDNVYKQLRGTLTNWPNPVPESFNTSYIRSDLKSESFAWWTEPANFLQYAGQYRIKEYMCPSDNVDRGSVTTGIVSLQINNGTFTYITIPEATTLGRTNYVGVAGAAGDFDEYRPPLIPKRVDYSNPASSDGSPAKPHLWDRYLGTMYNRSYVTLGLLSTQDGTSNTLLFGETLGSTGTGSRSTAFTWFGAGALGTAYGIGNSNEPGLDAATPPPLGSTPQPGTGGASWFRFSSRHRDGVLFCFADNSVRKLRFLNSAQPDLSNNGDNNSAWSTLQKLAARRDGLVPQIVPVCE